MKNSYRRYFKFAIVLSVLVASLFLIQWAGESGLFRSARVEAKITPETVFFDKANPNIRAVMAIQDRHTHALMALPDVAGTATGIAEDGTPAVLVFTKRGERIGMIPENLEGAPVVVKVTGEIFAMPKPPTSNKVNIDPASRFDRPVPIGVSTGNEGECSAGTIGARVKKGNSVYYALSNNHVYALENAAQIGSRVLQPGLYDTKCIFNSNDVIGALADFQPIVFSTTANNTMDAAIASSSIDILSNATPSNGYGTPKSQIASPVLSQNVQKYGRTTSLTKGTIWGINSTVNVMYDFGTARFVNQIVVYSNKPFIKPGDSGSLLVTNPGRNPVGLLFAGNASGTYAWANKIDLILTRFGVTIDGE